jgi:hypothetical protein
MLSIMSSLYDANGNINYLYESLDNTPDLYTNEGNTNYLHNEVKQIKEIQMNVSKTIKVKPAFNSFAFLSNGGRKVVRPDLTGIQDSKTGESLIAKAKALKYIRGC